MKKILFIIISSLFLLSGCGGGGASSESSPPSNVLPIGNAVSYSLDEDSELSETVTGSDADGDSLSFSIGSNAQNGQVSLNSDGSFTYTPSENFNGSDSFQFSVSDGKGSSVAANVSLTINPVNDPPTASDAMFSHDEDTLLTEILIATDVDEDELTVVIVNGPVNGTISQINGLEFEFTPQADYFGTDQFTFEVNDGELTSGVHTVDIEIVSVNDAPRIAFPENMTFNEAEIFDVDITIIDIDGTIIQEGYDAGLTSIARAAMLLENGLDFRFFSRGRLSDTQYVYSLFAIDNENARTDVSFTFTVLAGPDADNDGVTNFNDYDDDDDGYSDFYESLLGSDSLDRTSVPLQTPLDAGIDFTADADADAVSNAQEIKSNSNPLDSSVYPGYVIDEVISLVPFAASDSQKPDLLAIAPLNTSYDFSTGALPIEFAYTLADSQNNIAEAIILVSNDVGQKYEQNLILPDTNLVIGSAFLIDANVSQFFANGQVTTNICAIDTIGNGLSPFGGIDKNCVNPISFISSNTATITGNSQANIDLITPVLNVFDLPLTFNRDTDGSSLSIPITANDQGIGIGSIEIILRPKNQITFNPEEFISVSKVFTGTATVVETLVLTDISPFVREGVWQVASVFVRDLLGNDLIYSVDFNGVSELEALGFNSEIVFTNSQSDPNPPILSDITLITAKVNLNDPNPVIQFNVTGSDAESGVIRIDADYIFDDGNVPPEEIQNIVYVPTEEIIFPVAQNTLDYSHTSVPIPLNTTLGTHFLEIVIFDQAGNFMQNPNPMAYSFEVVRE